MYSGNIRTNGWFTRAISLPSDESPQSAVWERDFEGADYLTNIWLETKTNATYTVKRTYVVEIPWRALCFQMVYSLKLSVFVDSADSVATLSGAKASRRASKCR